MKKTYIFIHGGESFCSQGDYREWIGSTLVEWNKDPYSQKSEKKKWKIELANTLMERGNRVYFPNFPNPQNAKYSEWKYFFSIWISSIEIGGEIVFIATSLGGCFLLKYFSEKGNAGFLPTQEGQEQKGKNLKIHQIHLMAACQECGDFTSPTNYEYLQQLGNSVHIWHAEDDIIVPFSVGQELSRNLPGAETHFFSREKGYRHFHGVERIVELEEVILVK